MTADFIIFKNDSLIIMNEEKMKFEYNFKECKAYKLRYVPCNCGHCEDINIEKEEVDVGYFFNEINEMDMSECDKRSIRNDIQLNLAENFNYGEYFYGNKLWSL